MKEKAFQIEYGESFKEATILRGTKEKTTFPRDRIKRFPSPGLFDTTKLPTKKTLQTII